MAWLGLRNVRPGDYRQRDARSFFAREGWQSSADPVVWIVASFEGEQRRYQSIAWAGPCELIELIEELMQCDGRSSERVLCE